MLTEYKKVEVDQEWLNRVGTAFAIAWYEDSCLKIVKRQNELNEQKTKILEILEASGQDEDCKLENTVCAAIESYIGELQLKLQVEENSLVAVQGMDWIEIDREVVKKSLRGHGINVEPIDRNTFENGWQRAEAGY